MQSALIPGLSLLLHTVPPLLSWFNSRQLPSNPYLEYCGNPHNMVTAVSHGLDKPLSSHILGSVELVTAF